jgi:hypothetical protein
MHVKLVGRKCFWIVTSKGYLNSKHKMTKHEWKKAQRERIITNGPVIDGAEVYIDTPTFKYKGCWYESHAWIWESLDELEKHLRGKKYAIRELTRRSVHNYETKKTTDQYVFCGWVLE